MTGTAQPDFGPGGYLKGSRTKQNIMETLLKNRQTFRYYYDERRSAVADLQGKIYVQFFIAPSGSVVKAEVLENTANDPLFLQLLVNEVLKLDFGRIDSATDTAEVRYPFIFPH
jgi:hypothetical protein